MRVVAEEGRRTCGHDVGAVPYADTGLDMPENKCEPLRQALQSSGHCHSDADSLTIQVPTPLGPCPLAEFYAQQWTEHRVPP